MISSWQEASSSGASGVAVYTLSKALSRYRHRFGVLPRATASGFQQPGATTAQLPRGQRAQPTPLYQLE
jgi:hypothetical protein